MLVDGRPVTIENKPLELLHELLLRAGDVVSKDELLDAIWPGISVVEASLPTAVLKLRRALGDDQRDSRIIETVSRIGYRLAVPVEVESRATPLDPQPSSASGPIAEATPAAHPLPSKSRSWRRLVIEGAAAIVLVALTVVAVELVHNHEASPKPVMFTQRDATDAIRKVDIPRMEEMLRAGWDPNAPFDDQGNGALNMLINVCEWDPGHDKEELLLAARTLIEGGARITSHNIWGDTAYTIASAKRYCGPDHPITKMLRASCFTGYKPPGKKCLATRNLGLGR